MSDLEDTLLRFQNIESVSVREVLIGSAHVGVVLKTIRVLFPLLDHGDSFQKGLSRELWQLRAYILFTLLPFDSAELDLSGRLRNFTRGSSSIPAVAEKSGELVLAIGNLLKQPENPKYEWIKAAYGDAVQKTKEGKQGFLAMMAQNRTYGWPHLLGDCFNFPGAFQVIETRKALIRTVLDYVVIPGTCQFLSSTMFSELFYMGRIRAADILLYPGERFTLRERLRLPECSIFQDRLSAEKIDLKKESAGYVEAVEEDDLDACGQDDFWKHLHDGQKTSFPNSRAARYVLFSDDSGKFFPVGTQLLVWNKDALDEHDITETVTLDRIAEGDWLVIQRGDKRDLLDAESAAEDFDQRMDETSSWRGMLEHQLMTYSADDIAEQMRLQGARGRALPQSLQHWADGTVYGPRQHSIFQVLLKVLFNYEEQKEARKFNQEDFKQFVDKEWNALQKLRGIRQRAGVKLRRHLQGQLATALKNINDFTEGQTVHLESGVQVLLKQVAAVDEQVSWVPNSQIAHIDDKDGNRWQG